MTLHRLDRSADRMYRRLMSDAVFAGSFDPPTWGHIDVIRRACGIFDRLHVVVAVNRTKTGLFSPAERASLLAESIEPTPSVIVRVWDGLVVDYAREHGCRVLVRGIRSMPDFAYEFDLSVLNKGLDPAIETVLIPTDPKYFVLRSSAIRELAFYGRDLSSMVPPPVERALRSRTG